MAKNEKNFVKVVKNDGAMGFVLFMAWLGALVYFVQRSDGFGEFIVAILKSIVWPAFVLHRVLELLSL